MNCLILIVYRKCISAYWILYSEFGLISRIGSFFDVSDGQFTCKINRTSSNFTAFKLNTVERSEDLSNKACVRGSPMVLLTVGNICTNLIADA